MSPKRSPLAPNRFPDLAPVAGVEIGAVVARLRYSGRPDLMLLKAAPGTSVAGVLTRNAVTGAPVDWCRRRLKSGHARALVVTAGNANVLAGRDGARVCAETAAAAAAALDCRAEDVLLAATGVIGEVPVSAPIAAGVRRAAGRLRPDAWRQAAAAIRTTDTFPKGASRRTEIDGRPVTITGIAKGSGMIAPDMATMLAFLATDAALPAAVLRACLRAANAESFNCLTVDSDTSTSDTVLLFATGRGPRHRPVTTARDRRLGAFRAALTDCMADLARQIARDGEGATKLITVTVTGAAGAGDARAVARAVAESPLVKTAIAGEDANWGRIAMAVGKAGARVHRDRLTIAIGGTVIAERGGVRPGYDEAVLGPHLAGREIEIAVGLGLGRGRARFWTCDLTHGYIDINADYRS